MSAPLAAGLRTMELSHGCYLTLISAVVICSNNWPVLETHLCPCSDRNFRAAVTKFIGGEGALKANNRVSTPLFDAISERNTEWDLVLM